MIIDGKVYRDQEHQKWCLCPTCVAKDVMKKSFAETYRETFEKDPAEMTEEEWDSISEGNHRFYSWDQSDGFRAAND